MQINPLSHKQINPFRTQEGAFHCKGEGRAGKTVIFFYFSFSRPKSFDQATRGWRYRATCGS